MHVGSDKARGPTEGPVTPVLLSPPASLGSCGLWRMLVFPYGPHSCVHVIVSQSELKTKATETPLLPSSPDFTFKRQKKKTP